MTEGGAWARARLVDRRAHDSYEKYGRLAAVAVAVVFVVEVVRLALHPHLGDAIGLMVDLAIATWFFWPLFRGLRLPDGRIGASTQYIRATWVAVGIVVAAAVVVSLAIVL